jgi:hypothetical protein
VPCGNASIRPTLAGLALAGLALIALVGCAAAEDRPASPATASGSNGFVRITLTLEGPPRNDALSWASVSIANLTDRGVRWAGGGCGDPGGTFINVGGAFAPGRGDWPGRLGLFKQRAIGQGLPGGDGALTVGYVPASRIGTTQACTADLRIETLPVGGTLQYRAGWDGKLNERPVPPGPATVLATFPFIGLEGAVAADDVDSTAVTATMPTQVVGAGGAAGGPPPGLAVDAALADPQFAAFVQAAPEATWVNPDLSLIDGIWHVGLFRTSGPDQDVQYEAVFIDANGQVVGRRSGP